MKKKNKRKIKVRNRNLQAAHDYRSQQQKRYGYDGIAVKYDLSAHAEAAIDHLRQFFPEKDIPAYAAELERIARISGDTPLDEPLGHEVMSALRDQIETACADLGYELRGGISVGILHADGFEAMQQSVMLTDTSIIMMTGHLNLLINRLAKLLALTIPFEVEGGQFRICEDFHRIVAHANSDHVLRGYWAKFFIDHAENPLAPQRGDLVVVTGAQRQTMWSDLLEAMQLFVVGHEYAHHILEHSLGGEASVKGPAMEGQHRMEHEADILGLMLSMRAGSNTKPENIFAMTGIGAVSVLAALEYCRAGKSVLKTGAAPSQVSRDDHPPLEKRLDCIRVVSNELLAPYGAKDGGTVDRMQGLFVDIIRAAWGPAEEALKQAHSKGVRPVEPENTGWLP